MSTQHTPMAQVSEDAVFFLRKQADGSRWPVGTKLYAESPVIVAAPDLLEALQEAALWVDGDLKNKVRAAIAKAQGSAA